MDIGFRLPAARNLLFNLLLTLLLSAALQPQLQAGVGICFAASSDGDVLTSIGANGRNPFPYIDLYATGSIEALAFSLDASTLYATDDGQFGFLDLDLGGFTPIGGGVGTATTGSDGMIVLDDIDGLDFDATTGILYGSQRRAGVQDILIQINPVTGAFVAGAFGGADYVVIASAGLGSDLVDIDDIAFDPSTGQMYASLTDQVTGSSRLILVDKATGAVTDVGEFTDAGGSAIGDMEGLTFSPAGILYGSTGDFSALDLAPPENSLYTVDPASGLVRLVGPLTTSEFLGIEDYEGLACLDTVGHKISGYVFADDDGDGVFEPGDGEKGQEGVFVRLYELPAFMPLKTTDPDGYRGLLLCCEFFLYSVVTDINGYYEFEVFPVGDYGVFSDPVTFPEGANLTTGNFAAASFSSAVEPDSTGNNFGLDLGPVTPPPLGVCYTVADDGDFLTAIGTLGYGPTFIGDLDPMFGGLSVEAIAFDSNGTLYGTDAGTLGTIDLSSGVFSPFGAPVGSGDGAEGMEDFDDIDGLEFDPMTGILYGTVRRSDFQNDLLIQIDHTTGLFIPDAFGAGMDYVVIDTIIATEFPDVDDIAIDPSDGQMYGVTNDFGDLDTLILIDKATGAVTEIDFLADFDGFLIGDVEGLTFAPDGRLYATTGNFSATPLTPPENTFYLVDKHTAYATELGPLVADPDPYGDHEAVSCLAQGNLISGFVFADDDLDGLFEPGDGEGGYQNALVSMYNDNDNSGGVTAGDTLLAQVLTLADGSFQFGAPAFGKFLITIDTSTLPSGFGLTTDNLETATFTAFTDPPDINNNFGFAVADVSVTKTAASSSYIPGSTLDFTIEVANSGPDAAANVMVADSAPTDTSISSWTCSAGGGASCPNDSGSGDLNETVPSLPAGGTLTYVLTLQISPDLSTPITNTVTVSSDTSDPDDDDLTASAEASALPPVADVSVTKVADDIIYVPGLSTTFTVAVRNDGPSNAANVMVSDLAPMGTIISGWTCTGSGVACPNASGSGDINESVLLLPPGASLTYEITVATPPGQSGTLINTVDISSDTSDPDDSDWSAMASIGTSAPSADIQLSKTPTQNYYIPGFTAEFEVVVSNQGPSNAGQVAVSDVAPAGTTIESWTCTASLGALCPNDSGSGDLNELIPLLPAGESLTYLIQVKTPPDRTDPVENTATASSSRASDPNEDNNTASAAVDRLPPSSVPFLGIPELALLAGLLGLAGWLLIPGRKL